MKALYSTLAALALFVFFGGMALLIEVKKPSFGDEVAATEDVIRVVVLNEGERIGYICTTYERTADGYMLYDAHGKMIAEIHKGAGTVIFAPTKIPLTNSK